MTTFNDEELKYLQEHEMSRRDFMLDAMAMGGLAAGMTLPGMSLANMTPPDDEVVRIGYLPITDATALLVAHGMGFFEDEGLKAEKPTLIRGWSPLVEGFAAGKFNLVHLLKPIPVWMRYNNNFPVKVMSWAHINGSALVVGKHTGRRGLQRPRWYADRSAVLVLDAQHRAADGPAQCRPEAGDQGSQDEPLAADEVNLMIMPPPDMPPALAAKKIDAFIVAEPFNAFGELKAGGKMLRFTGDMWKNHPCCVICMNEQTVAAKPEWTQKVMNAIVRAEIYAQENKEEVAMMMSRDGKKYLPMPGKAVVRAMTYYDEDKYAKPHAIRNTAEFANGRIDFSPFPYPSATKLIVESMNETLVGGDKTFLTGLDPQFVADDLVDYKHVKVAMEKHKGWENAPGVDPANPFEREEVVKI